MPKRHFQRRRKPGRSNRFIMLDHALLDSAAWEHLTPYSVKLLLAVWRRHDGDNNGYICFSRREAMALLKCGSHKAQSCFEELQTLGFIQKVGESWFGKTDRNAREWAVTAESIKDEKPTRDFAKWSPGNLNVGAPTTPDRCSHDTYSPKSGPAIVPIRCSHDTYNALSAPSHRCSYGTTFNIPGGGIILSRVFFTTERTGSCLQQAAGA